MAYEPPQVWVEARSTGYRCVHLTATCPRIREDSTVVGPLLIGVALAGKSTGACRCAKDTKHATNDGRRPAREVSGGLPTLGRRR